jgi:2-C-methyl-D-erythritol 4-phosphate cytidylyltransferase
VKNVAVILAAAGKSTRFGDPFSKKVFTLVSGRAMWLHSADILLDHPRVGQLILVIDRDDYETFREKFSASIAMMGIEIAWGGGERWQSVQNALEKVRPEMKLVAVHDAARPCLARSWLDRVIERADETGAAILATEIFGTVKKVDRSQKIVSTVDREGLWQAQTPQVFERALLGQAYAKRGTLQPTDEAQLVEQTGRSIAIVPCSPLNIKITTKEDLKFAELAMKALPKSRGFPF